MPEIKYRDAVQSDALRLSILFSQVYIHAYGIEGVSTEFANFIDKNFSVQRISTTIAQYPGLIKLASYNDNLVGVIEIKLGQRSPVGNITSPEISKLYVLERFTGQGIGERLLSMAENFLVKKGYQELWLWVWLPNIKAIRFYEKQHYTSIGEALFEMETNTYDNLIMWKKLGS